MLTVPSTTRVLLARWPVDGRRGVDALLAQIRSELDADVFSGSFLLPATRCISP